MDDEFYFDGMHNSGVFNSFNHSVYTYCYQNPIKLIDPNGKQVESEYLGSWSTDSSFINGAVDGLIDNIPGWGAIKEIGKLTTDSKYRAQMLNMLETIAANPIAFLEKVAKDKIEGYKAVLSGGGTDQQKYDVGNDLGGLLPSLIGGGLLVKLLKDLKKDGIKVALKASIKKLCFIAGTLVVTTDGLKKIEEIQVGDEVWSYNEQTGEIEIKEVVSLSQNTSEELIEVSIENEKIVCTPEHPFFIDNNWIEAKNLKLGNKLTLKNGKFVSITKIQRLNKTVKVYNFEVAENHNYYVSELEVLVHNNCWGSFKEAMSSAAQKTKLTFQGASIYKVTNKKNPFGLKKGDHYYLDNLHKDHIEVFDSNGKAKKVLNLDGSLNVDKTNKILEEKRTIKIK